MLGVEELCLRLRVWDPKPGLSLHVLKGLLGMKHLPPCSGAGAAKSQLRAVSPKQRAKTLKLLGA